MQTVAMQSSVLPVGADEQAVLKRLAELKQQIHSHRAQARAAWDACAPTQIHEVAGRVQVEHMQVRTVLGENTKKLLGGQ